MSPSKKESFFDRLTAVFSRLSTQRHLVTIRDAFGLVTPVIIAGALSLIGAIFFFGGSGGASTSILGWIAKAAGGVKVDGNTWTFIGPWLNVSKIGANIFANVTSATIGLFSIYVAFEIAYVFVRAYKPKTDAVMAGVISVASFGIVSHGFSGGNSMFMGANGLLISIIVAFFSSWLFSKISEFEKLKIKMPKEVPPAIALGFSYIIPIFLTLVLVGVIDSVAYAIGLLSNLNIVEQKVHQTAGHSFNPSTGAETTWIAGAKYSETVLSSGNYGFAGLMYKLLTAPFNAFTGSSMGGLGIAIFYSFFVAFFWWFGINGSSVMNGVFSPILIGLILKNTAAVESAGGYAAANAAGMLSTVSITFMENYTQLTGWGMTGGLILSTYVFSKVKSKREIAKLASVPAIFNVNEPMTFGYPIMLNPIYAIPCMIIMPINAIIAFLAVDTFGWVRKTYLMVPWTVPPGVGALLGTGFDWKALVLAWFCLSIAFLIYIPFVFLENIFNKKQTLKLEEEKKNKEALKTKEKVNKVEINSKKKSK